MDALETLARTLYAEAGTRPVRAIEALAALAMNRARALAGALPDPTGAATHWHGAECLPAWAIAREPSAEVAGLIFYRLETGDRPVRPAAPALVAVA